MRKEKKKINYLIYSAGAILIAGAVYMALISETIALTYGFWGLVIIGSTLYVSFLLKKRLRERENTWRDIFKSSCTKINYSSSEFGLKRNVGYILSDLCKVRNITGAWILIKKDDGNFRLQAQRGIERLDHNFSVKNLSEYISEHIKNFTSPLIKKDMPTQVKSDNKDAIMHIPITRGKLVRGVLSITARSSREFKKSDVNNFLIIARLLEQLYENADQSNQLQNVARKVNEKVDITTNELTKTNLRLIDRVKELKSLYDLSLKVINAEDTADAAQFIFRKINVILGAEKSLFFEKKEGEFKLKYISDTQPDSNLIGYSLPFSILPQKKGLILNDTKADQDLNYFAHHMSLKHIMISPVKAGETIKGLIIAGGEELNKFSGRDVELLEMYSGRLGEYIERKELLNRILKDNKRLKELNHIKDNFIALISHELRTPLTSIKGFGELLLNGDVGQVNSEQQDFLKIILNAAVKLEITINSIIEATDFKKGEVNLKKENVKWAYFVEGIVDEFKEILNSKEISCKIKISSDIDKLYVDRKRIKKVFENLLSNAVKFTTRGGAIEISSCRDGDNVKTAVKDSGIGINKDMKDKVFEGFTQAQEPLTRDNDGLGIGLTLVKYIIESHDGDIYINSKSGLGTEVVFSLPNKDNKKEKISSCEEEK